MPAVKQAIPSAVPAAVTRAGSVAVNAAAQRAPRTAPSASSSVPYVPGGQPPGQAPAQPPYAGAGTVGSSPAAGSPGAPSLPPDGLLFTAPPIDAHYQVPSDANPYGKVNNPPTRGMLTFILGYANHVFQGRQNVDNAGWQVAAPQQRTSWMRFGPPPRGGGYAPATFTPQQQPQQPNTYRFNPVTGPDAPGPVRGQAVILNSATYGAGQTAGGVGGAGFTAPVPPPDVSPVTAAGDSGMPVWGA